MKRAIIMLAFLIIAASSGSGQNPPAIQWEVVNPFPFIHEQKYIDELRAVYSSLPSADGKLKRDASGLERALQNKSDDDTDKERAKGTNCLDPSDDQKPICRAPYSGWFARVAKDPDGSGPETNYAATCWDPVNRKYLTTGKCKGYLYPEFYWVRLWIDDHRIASWFKGGATFPSSAYKNCDEGYNRLNCIEFKLPYAAGSGSNEWSMSAALSDGTAVAAVPVRVKDRLVVGLGDSYAVGEGNPDIPAKFTQGRTDVDFLYRLKVRRNPQKDKGGEAVWMDERCHRSMYSYQFKTALQMALEDPHKAVTFISYSCSGGITPNIIDTKQKPKEIDKRRAHKGEFATIQPQLKVLYGTLEPPALKPRREVDYLLLSTGGNDAKFARFVSYVVTSGFVKLVSSKTPKETTGQKVKDLLLGKDGKEGNYLALQKAIFNGKYNVPIQGCVGGGENLPLCPNIILTAYPDLMVEGPVEDNEKEDPDICRADRGEFDIPFKKDKKRPGRIVKARKWVFVPLRETQEDSFIPTKLGWRVVKDHFDDYVRHGFCAQDESSQSETAEKFVMPKRKNGEWTPFEPWNYRPYEQRGRWIKIPVDSKLSTDQTHVFRSYSFDLFFEDDRANIIHPTAEGLARTADATMIEIRERESAQTNEEKNRR